MAPLFSSDVAKELWQQWSPERRRWFLDWIVEAKLPVALSDTDLVGEFTEADAKVVIETQPGGIWLDGANSLLDREQAARLGAVLLSLALEPR